MYLFRICVRKRWVIAIARFKRWSRGYPCFGPTNPRKKHLDVEIKHITLLTKTYGNYANEKVCEHMWISFVCFGLGVVQFETSQTNNNNNSHQTNRLKFL